ncbi:MAG: glutamate synthase, partial [Spartobacteria bacterium]|nr:glutamate synthase [Spartobacteria bacterium]
GPSDKEPLPLDTSLAVEDYLAESHAAIAGMSEAKLTTFLDRLLSLPLDTQTGFDWVTTLLGWLNDRPLPGMTMKRSVFLNYIRQALNRVLAGMPDLSSDVRAAARRVDVASAPTLRAPRDDEVVLVVDAAGFEPEGNQGHASCLVRAYALGWRRFVVYGLKGHRFTGCGLGPGTTGVRIDVWGSSGDYLGSGMDGLEMHIHDSAQDQLAQILKRGRLVIHGDVGQAFMYGAKGGEVYVRGNAAGRALINAVGSPRVIINGTCLDFLAESFMAGDPLHGGGFVVLNGLTFDPRGRSIPQDTPYPGSNIFSLASGGAIYVRDPKKQLVEEQLNSGEYVEFTEQDWSLIRPYLETNEALFGIAIEQDLLTVDGTRRAPAEVYRKIRPPSRR